MMLPPLPAAVFSAYGAIPVVLTADPKILDEDDFGAWNAHTRVIYVRAGLHATPAWLTLFHEKVHADLSDAGVRLPTNKEEAVCNAIAAARFAELLDSLRGTP